MEYHHVIIGLRQPGKAGRRVAAHVRNNADAKEQLAVLSQFATDDELNRNLLTGICFAKDLDELWSVPFTPDITNSQRAATWFSSVALRHIDSIELHVQLSSKVDRAALNGDWQQVSAILDQHKAAFGPTHWSIRWLFVMAEEMHGAQFRTQLFERFSKSTDIGAAGAFVRFYNLAAEKSLPEEHYRTTIRNTLPEVRPMRRFLEFLIFEDCSLDWKASEMFSSSEFVPLLDRYEFFVRLTAFALSSGHSDAVKLARVAVRLAGFCSDPRLRYLAQVSSVQADVSFDTDNLLLEKAWDAYVRGDYLNCFSLSEAIARQRPDYFYAHELLVKAAMYLRRADQFTATATAPIQLLWYHLKNVFCKNEHSEDSLGYLLRFSSRFPVFPVTSPLRALHSQHSAPFDQDNSWHRRAAFTFVAHGPRNFEYGHTPEFNAHYIERCRKVLPDALALRFFLIVARAMTLDAVDMVGEVPAIRRLFFLGISAARRNYHTLSIDCLNKFLLLQVDDTTNPLSPFAMEEARRALVDQFRLTGAIEEMQRTVVAAFIDRPQSIRRLSIRGVYETSVGCIDRASQQIEFPIVAFLACDEPHEISMALKRFLRKAGIVRPSERVVQIKDEINTIAVLFSRVCTPEVLDSLQSLNTVEKVEAERVQLLRWVIDNAPAYARFAETEVLRLTQHSELREALQKVEGARVVLNVPALRESEKERFSNAFYRFVAQRELTAQAEAELFTALMEQRQGLSRLLPKVLEPREATFAAFASAFRDIRDAFVGSPHSGIEACLSGRIRHGHIIQHIRKPLVEHRLAVKRDGFDRLDIENFWRLKLNADKEDSRLDRVMQILFTLTEQIDASAEEVKSVWIQSRTETRNANGMFDYAYSNEQLHLMLGVMNMPATVDEFLDFVFDSLLLRTRESLVAVRARITEELSRRLAESVSAAIASANDDEFMVPLRNDLVACRQDLERTCQQLARWFQDTNSSLVGDARFDLVAKTAIGMIERLNPHMRGQHSTDVRSERRVRGRYFTALVHILFFLLDNAVKYSLVPKDKYSASVTILSDDSELFVIVKNRLSDAGQAKKSAEDINARIAAMRSMLDPAKVVKEGGSGFAKIMATLTYEFSQPLATVNATSQGDILEVRLTCGVTGITA